MTIRDRQVAAPLKLSLFSLNEFPLPTEMGVSPQIQCLRVPDEVVQQTPEPKLDDELVAQGQVIILYVRVREELIA